MSEPVDLTPAVQRLQAVAQHVSVDDLPRPTPDEGRSVGELIGHLVGLTAAFRAAAAKDLGELTDTSPDANGWPPAPADWRTLLADQGQALAEAWQAPAAWEGMTRAGGVDLPGDIAGLVALDEVVLHGWDLARSTGQEYDCDDATTRVLLEFIGGFDLAGTPGMFGPAVDVPESAPAFEKVLARSGRNPAWVPDS